MMLILLASVYMWESLMRWGPPGPGVPRTLVPPSQPPPPPQSQQLPLVRGKAPEDPTEGNLIETECGPVEPLRAITRKRCGGVEFVFFPSIYNDLMRVGVRGSMFKGCWGERWVE